MARIVVITVGPGLMGPSSAVLNPHGLLRYSMRFRGSLQGFSSSSYYTSR